MSSNVELSPKGAEPGSMFFWLNPSNPYKARKRVGNLYWKAGRRFAMAFFLLLFGITFLIIGITCMCVCDDFDRGVAFFIIGLLLFTPGSYASYILFCYLRCHKGYSWKLLPEVQ
eukprot:PhF_6_TR24301/c0_g1_i1/m.33739